MVDDIRISITFFAHPKTVKLARRKGIKAVINLQQLWIWFSQNKPTGKIKKEKDTIEDLEIAASWEGDRGELFQVLLDLGFLDIENTEKTTWYVLHNWGKHQSWVVGAEERKAKATKAARARWNKPEHAPSNATSMPQAMLKRGSSNAPSPSYPFLSLPDHEEKKEERKNTPSPSGPGSVISIKRDSLLTETKTKLKEIWITIAEKWSITKRTGGKAFDKNIKAYVKSKADAARAIAALEIYLEVEPQRWHSKHDADYWSLAWIFAQRDSKHNPVDRPQDILDGRFQEREKEQVYDADLEGYDQDVKDRTMAARRRNY